MWSPLKKLICVIPMISNFTYQMKCRNVVDLYKMGVVFGRYRKYEVTCIGSKQIFLGEKVHATISLFIDSYVK